MMLSSMNTHTLRISTLFILLAWLQQTHASDSPKQLVARYSSWAAYGPGIELNSLPLDKMTHLIYEMAILQEDGSLAINDSFIDLRNDVDFEGVNVNGNYELIRAIKLRYPSLKVLVNVGGWTLSTHFSTVFASREHSKRFSESVNRWTQEYSFDGVAIDWRYPVGGGVTTNSTHPDDIKHLTKWVKDFKQTPQGGNTLIWMALTGRGISGQQWNMVDLNRWIDRFEILSLDYFGGWSSTTWHSSALKTPLNDPQKPSADKAITYWTDKGVSRNKILLSINSMSVSWGGVNKLGLGQPVGMVPTGSFDTNENSGHLRYESVLALAARGDYERRWDNESEATYLYNSQEMDGHFISFEDQQSLKNKVNYVREKNLAGIIVHQIYADSMDSSGIFHQLNEYLFHPYRTLQYLLTGLVIFILTGWLSYWLWLTHIQRILRIRHLTEKVVPQLEQLKYVTDTVMYQAKELENQRGSSIKQLKHYQAVGQEWNQFSITLLNGLNFHSESDCKLEGDIKTWIEGTIARFNLSSCYFELIPTKDENDWTCSFDPHVLMDMFRHIQLNYNGSPVQLSLDGESSKLIHLNMRIPGSVSRVLTSNIDSKLKILEDGQYQVSWRKAESPLAAQRSDALLNFKKSITGPLDNDFLSKKLIEIIKSDPQVQDAWLTSSEDEKIEDQQRNNLTYALEASSNTHIEIQGKTKLGEDDQLFFRSLFMQVEFAKQCVGNLLENKRLLSELYQIVESRKNILFVRGEKGYSGVYMAGEKEPLIVLMRLRHILWYFRSETFIQVHRSYIVDLDKIDSFTKKKGAYEISIGGHSIQVTRRYQTQVEKILG